MFMQLHMTLSVLFRYTMNDTQLINANRYLRIDSTRVIRIGFGSAISTEIGIARGISL